MRRFASALAALGLAATLMLSSPTPASAGVLSGLGHIVTGAGGAILSVGKGVLCKGLSAAGQSGKGRRPSAALRSAALRPVALAPRRGARPGARSAAC